MFYPWRLWKPLTRKEVVPVFLTYSNRAYGFFQYGFKDEDNYHSVELVRKQWFTLDEPEGIASLADLFESSRAVTPAKPFPQADTLGTVIATVELYAAEITAAADIAERLGFDERQGQYYTTAALWLGLVERNGGKINLSARGKEFASVSRWARFEILFRAVAATPVFRECIRRKLESKPASAEEIAGMILANDYANQTTANRRAKTVVAWLDWLWREHTNLSA